MRLNVIRTYRKESPGRDSTASPAAFGIFISKGPFSSPLSEGQSAERPPCIPDPWGMSLQPHRLLWLCGLAQSIPQNPCQVIAEHGELPMSGWDKTAEPPRSGDQAAQGLQIAMLITSLWDSKSSSAAPYFNICTNIGLAETPFLYFYSCLMRWKSSSKASGPDPVLFKRALGVLQGYWTICALDIYSFRPKLFLLSLERNQGIGGVGADLSYHKHFKGCEFTTLVRNSNP